MDSTAFERTASHRFQRFLALFTPSAAPPTWREILLVATILFVYLLLRVPDPHFLLTNADHATTTISGQLLLAGKVHGIQVFNALGPMISVVGALGIALFGPAPGGLVIGVLGNVALRLIGYVIVRRHGGRLGAWMAVFLMTLFFHRYYKWYHLFFPAASLYFAIISFESNRNAKQNALLWGGVAGLGGLFRYDLGVIAVGMAVCVAMVGLAASQVASLKSLAAEQRPVRNLLLFLLTFSLFQVLYYLVLAAVSGNPFQFAVYHEVLRATMAMQMKLKSTPLPVLDSWSLYPSEISFLTRWSFVISLYLTPVLYLFSMALAVMDLFANKERGLPLTMFFVAVTGLALYPQTLYRAMAGSLVGVLLPLWLLWPLWWAWMQRRGKLHAFQYGAFVLANLGLAFLVVMMFHGKLFINNIYHGAPFRDQFALWSTLAHLPESMAGKEEAAEVALALKRHTRPDETVFMVSVKAQHAIVTHSGRILAGVFAFYYEGLPMDPHWKGVNVEELRTHPPAVIAVTEADWRDPPPDTLAPFDAGLLTEWYRTYTVPLERIGKFLILGRGHPASPGTTP